MKRRAFPAIRVLASLSLAATGLALSGCADLPRDQHGATERIRQSRVLTVGVPTDENDSPVARREREVLQKIATRLGATIEYKKGDSHQLLQDLENLKYPIVAASLPSDSPFAQSVGMSQPYWKNGPERKDYCLAVAPGENRLLFIVDQVILEEQKSRNATATARDVSTHIAKTNGGDA
jgi:hypothetical protein